MHKKLKKIYLYHFDEPRKDWMPAHWNDWYVRPNIRDCHCCQSSLLSNWWKFCNDFIVLTLAIIITIIPSRGSWGIVTGWLSIIWWRWKIPALKSVISKGRMNKERGQEMFGLWTPRRGKCALDEFSRNVTLTGEMRISWFCYIIWVVTCVVPVGILNVYGTW